MIKQVHFVVLVSDLVRQARCPRLDLVKLVPCFVVSSLAHVDLLTFRQSARSTLEVTREEHDEALALNFLNVVVAISSSL